jgi:excisionase family DNA binding protein
LWTVPEVADYYRVTERTVRNWIDKGALDVDRKGRTVRVHAPCGTTLKIFERKAKATDSGEQAADRHAAPPVRHAQRVIV